jgi:hypothetical protein
MQEEDDEIRWLERYPWYLELSTKRRDWVNRFVAEVSPEVFVGMKAVQSAIQDNDFSLLAEIIVAYDEVSQHLISELSTDDEAFD